MDLGEYYVTFLFSQSLLREPANKKLAETAALVADWWVEEHTLIPITSLSAKLFTIDSRDNSTPKKRLQFSTDSTSWGSWQV